MFLLEPHNIAHMENLSSANERVERDLLAIRSRLMGIKTFRGSVPQSVEQRLLQRLLQVIENRPISAARSEYFAGRDELQSLIYNRVNPIRGFVLETGRKGKDIPGYEDMVSDSDNLWGPEGLENRYWREDGRVDVFADRDPVPLAKDEESERKEKLYLVVVEPEHTLFILFDFKNNFSLEGKFSNPDNKERALWYDSSTIPLSKMTDEEFRIIKHYLDEYFSKFIVPSKIRV